MRNLTTHTTRALSEAKLDAMAQGMRLNAKYKIQITERSSHNETTDWNTPRRIQLLEQIFGFEVKDYGKATINLSNPWMVSDIITHYSRPVDHYVDAKANQKYQAENRAINKSCNFQKAVITNKHTTGTIPMYNRQVYARIIDLPNNKLLLNILKEMKAAGCKDYEEFKVYKLGAKGAAEFLGGRPTDIKRRKAKYAEAHS